MLSSKADEIHGKERDAILEVCESQAHQKPEGVSHYHVAEVGESLWLSGRPPPSSVAEGAGIFGNKGCPFPSATVTWSECITLDTGLLLVRSRPLTLPGPARAGSGVDPIPCVLPGLPQHCIGSFHNRHRPVRRRDNARRPTRTPPAYRQTMETRWALLGRPMTHWRT